MLKVILRIDQPIFPVLSLDSKLSVFSRLYQLNVFSFHVLILNPFKGQQSVKLYVMRKQTYFQMLLLVLMLLLQGREDLQI